MRLTVAKKIDVESQHTEAPSKLDLPDFAPRELTSQLRSNLDRLLKCSFMDEAESITKEILSSRPDIREQWLTLAKRWVWTEMSNQYNPETVWKMYELVRQYYKWPIGPNACRYCRTPEEVLKQIQNAHKVLDGYIDAFEKRDYLHVTNIADYKVKMGIHSCEFGNGLITFSMFKDAQRLYQISVYPSSPFTIYEIKGVHSDDRAESKSIKRAMHRFKSKYGESVPARLVKEICNKAAECGEEVRIARGASRWRNYGIEDNKDRGWQADKQHYKLARELNLSFDMPHQALYQTIQKSAETFHDWQKASNSRGQTLQGELFAYGLKSEIGQFFKQQLEENHALVAETLTFKDFSHLALHSRYAEFRLGILWYELCRLFAPEREYIKTRTKLDQSSFEPPTFYAIPYSKLIP